MKLIDAPTLVLATIVVLVASSAASQPSAHQVGSVSNKVADSAARSKEPLPGLDSELSDVVRSLPTGHSRGRTGASDRIQVEIHLEPSARSETHESIGQVADVTKQRNDGTILQAWAAPSDLEHLSAVPGIGMIRRPPRALSLGRPGVGRLRSEGSDFFEVQAWHDVGLQGQGVTIGVIDVGFEGYRDLLGSELPENVTARSFVDDGDTSDLGGERVHGTAVGEILHDVAPAARLAFARVDTPADFSEATEWLVEEQGVDIISTSISYINATPGDGTGFFADVISWAVDRGVFWATSAGNWRESHWSGSFRDFSDDDIHHYGDGSDLNWGGPGDGQAYFLESDLTFRVFLRWDDWSEVDQDFDLYLYRWDGDEWKRQSANGGRDRQRGRTGEYPVEMAWLETRGDPTAYGYEIRRNRSDRRSHLEVFAVIETSPIEGAPLPLHHRTAESSLPDMADSPAAVTVAAVEATRPFTQQPFSSEGPTNGPGGTASGGLRKPDISAYDGVSTASYGERAFFGTSASAPHISGAAALIKGAMPGWSPEQIRQFLTDRAEDLGPRGRDNRFGEGRLSLGAPLVPSPTATFTRIPTPTITRTPTITKTPTITPTPSNTPTPGPCYGDCDGNGIVSVNEIIIGVRLNLGLDDLARCAVHDVDGNRRVRVDELIRAVRAALFRCVGAA